MKPYDEYVICQKRGHQPSGVTLACMPPLQVCRWCGTNYRFETNLVERDSPPKEEGE